MNDANHISNPQVIAFSFSAAAIGITAVVATIRRLRGTTLVAAQGWVAASLLAVAGLEIWLDVAGEPWEGSVAQPLRYIVATLTFCPLMALLGAKRPQDRAWHFVVVSLWIVLALPALHVVLLRPGQELTMPPALAYFMMGLVVIGFLNRVMTRAWLSGFFFAAGQAALLPPNFPMMAVASDVDRQIRALVGLGLIVASAVLAWWGVCRRRNCTEPLDRLWLDFRDLFGVFWALRLAERVNSGAVAAKSDLVLRWSGFQTTAGGKIEEKLSPDAVRVLRQGLENLLRRFVSRDWIAERLQDPKHGTGVEHESP